MSVALMVKSSCLAGLLVASRFLMVVAAIAVAVTVGADVEHLDPIDDMGLRVRTRSSVVTVAWFEGVLFHLLLLLFLPCLGCVQEAEELCLDDFFLGR